MSGSDAPTRRLTRFWRPGHEFDPAAVARVTWLAATVSTPALLMVFPPTIVAPTPGWIMGWSWAVFHLVVLALAARRRATQLRVLYAASLVDMVMLGVVQWLAGGWSTPYHLFVFVNVYAIAVSQPPRRTVYAAPLALLATFAPLLYGGTDGRGADVAVAAGLWAILAWLGADVTSLIARQRRELERAATHDVLTGLENRRAFARHVDGLLARASVEGGALVGIGDIDLFKDVNDRHGHRTGDECLRSVALRVSVACRREDPGAAIFRWGGDEFVVVLALPRPTDAQAVSDRLDHGLSPTEAVLASVPSVGLTFGWTVWDGQVTGERAVELADRQLVARKSKRDTGLGSSRATRAVLPVGQAPAREAERP